MSDTQSTDTFIDKWCGYSPDVDRFSELASFTREMERALRKCAAVLAGDEMSKHALIDALKAARDVLKP